MNIPDIKVSANSQKPGMMRTSPGSDFASIAGHPHQVIKRTTHESIGKKPASPLLFTLQRKEAIRLWGFIWELGTQLRDESITCIAVQVADKLPHKARSSSAQLFMTVLAGSRRNHETVQRPEQKQRRPKPSAGTSKAAKQLSEKRPKASIRHCLLRTDAQIASIVSPGRTPGCSLISRSVPSCLFS